MTIERASDYCDFTPPKSRDWRVVLGLAVALAIQGLGCQREQSPPAVGGPRVTVDRDTQRLVANASGKVQATYRVTNRGDRDVSLGPITTTCGCTGATVEPSLIPPGSSAVVAVEGRPRLSGESAVRVFVPTSDPTSGTLTLNLVMVGNAPIPHVTTPDVVVSFGVLRTDAIPPAQDVTVDVLEHRADPPSVRSAECSLDFAKITGGLFEELPTSNPGDVTRRYRYEVALIRPLGPGPFLGDVSLRGDGREDDLLVKIPIRGLVREPVDSSPSTLNFIADEMADRQSRLVTLVAADPSFALVAECQDHDRSLTVRPSERLAGRVGFSIEFNPTTPRATIKPLVFRTNHPAVPMLTIPVHVLTPRERTNP